MDENKEFQTQNNSIDDDFSIENILEAQKQNDDFLNVPIKKKKKKKSKGILKPIIWILVIIILSVSLAYGIIYAGADFMGLGFGRGDNCTLNIEKGTSGTEIAEKLEETGSVKIPTLFRLYCKIKGYENKFQYGLYHFNTEAGYEDIAQMLMSEGAKAESVKVTIPEGTGINDYIKNVDGEDVTVKGITTILEEKGVCKRSDFLTALDNVKLNTQLLKNVNVGKTYHHLEGYLFPETYEFYKLESSEAAALVVEKMIQESEKRITKDMFARADELGYSMNEILTMASIIQMEAGKSTNEMPDVAAVFYNRLKSDSFKTLGSSPTCYYGESFKRDDGRYNTYNIEGLPPGPLCSPSISAIKAALYPTQNSPYYYFVTDKNGKFYFHETIAQQNATINSLKQGNNWIYEYFD